MANRDSSDKETAYESDAISLDLGHLDMETI